MSVIFVTSVFGLICAPGIMQFLGLDIPTSSAENRTLAGPPPLPSSLSDALNYPARLEPFLQDHFGFRSRLITLNNWMLYNLFGEFVSRQVVVGQRGRIFLTSHGASQPYSLIRAICGIGVSDDDAAGAARVVSKVIDRFRRVAPSIVFIAAPSPTSVYPEDLPQWLVRKCADAVPTMNRVAEKISAEDSGRFSFPIAIAKEANGGDPLIPYAGFHWRGTGVRLIMDSIATNSLGLTRRFEVPMIAKTEKSDLSQFMPGLVFEERIKAPDWSAVHVDFCYGGGSCFPEIGPIADLLGDVSHYRSPPGGRGRILVLSDSFGAASAGYFSAYFGEVVHFSVNYLDRLSTEQMKTFRNYIFDAYKPDTIVLLFHDGAIFNAPQRLERLLWQEQLDGAP
jgi:hypothetical protein